MNAAAGGVPPLWRLNMMNKRVIVALLTFGLVACAQDQAPKEDSRLKEAYSACINTAQGSPEKIEAC